MFKLTKEELLLSRSIFSTAIPIMQEKGTRGGRTSLPYVFTEQGVYMLMTVLRGELATKQSKALICLFKEMKDYIIESNNFLKMNEVLKLSNQINKNTKAIEKLKHENKTIETKLETIMNNFIDPSKYKHFLILDGQRIEADIAYQNIYSLANESIIIIDNYVNVKTLHNLKVAKNNVKVQIYSSNNLKDKITDVELNDFVKDTKIDVSIKNTEEPFHDRFIIIDYKKDTEKLFLSGPSSKDAGNKIATITDLTSFIKCYYLLFDKLLLL